jgi:hypothetical protein
LEEPRPPPDGHRRRRCSSGSAAAHHPTHRKRDRLSRPGGRVYLSARLLRRAAQSDACRAPLRDGNRACERSRTHLPQEGLATKRCLSYLYAIGSPCGLALVSGGLEECKNGHVLIPAVDAAVSLRRRGNAEGRGRPSRESQRQDRGGRRDPPGELRGAAPVAPGVGIHPPRRGHHRQGRFRLGVAIGSGSVRERTRLPGGGGLRIARGPGRRLHVLPGEEAPPSALRSQ